MKTGRQKSSLFPRRISPLKLVAETVQERLPEHDLSAVASPDPSMLQRAIPSPPALILAPVFIVFPSVIKTLNSTRACVIPHNLARLPEKTVPLHVIPMPGH